ncbi:MAG: transcriptional regulator [Thermoprotei archaeon]|nr:MAG: transcriptional regulator [Thermoprotei archaeon]
MTAASSANLNFVVRVCSRLKEVAVDEKDMQIIDMLLENARTPLTVIARRLGISDVAVKKRIKRLEETKVIRKFTIIVDPTKLGFKGFAYLGIDVEPAQLFNIVKYLSSKNYVKTLAITLGEHSLMAEIWARDSEELENIMKDLESKPGVKRICPAIVVELVKP